MQLNATRLASTLASPIHSARDHLTPFHSLVGCCLIMLILTLMIMPRPVFAHSGGLNAEGCHNNRKTGDYHCHRPRPTTALPPTTGFNNNTHGETTGSRSWAYPNCSAARAAGAAPIRRGQPGYGPHLDRDGDGIACE